MTEKTEHQHPTSATQVRQQWFSVGIFPLMQVFGLIPINRDNPPLRIVSYVCVLNQPLNRGKECCTKDGSPLEVIKRKPKPSEQAMESLSTTKEWPSADDFQE